MYTLFLIGVAVALALGFAFIVVLFMYLTTFTVIFIFTPVFKAMDTTWTQKGDALTPTILKLAIYSAAVIIPALFIMEYPPIVIGIYLGCLFGFRRALQKAADK